jgi:U3 small nucleolar RNA-associated protein 10
MLSILPRQMPQIFRFLYPNITALSNPTLHTILYTATHNQPFFSAFNQYVLGVAKARHHSSTLLSFWASVITQAVDGMISAAQSGRETVQKQRQEDLMLRVLPILNEALYLRDVPELVLGCCMITTVVAAKAHLEDHVLDGLMEALASGWTLQTTEARIVSLAVIAQKRLSPELSRSVTKKLSKLEDFPDRLLAVSENYKVDRLVLGYIMGCFKRLLKSGKESHSAQMETIEKLIRAEILENAELRLVIKDLLSTAKKLQKAGGFTAEQQSSFAALITLFANSPSSSDLFQRALTKSSFTQNELELALQTVISRRVEAPPATENDSMEGVEPTTRDSSFNTAMSLIIDKKPRRVSFLSVEMSEEFNIFYSVFMQSLSLEQDLQTFIKIPALDQEWPLTLVSFCIRVWSANHPQVARCAALRIMATLLQGVKDKDVDFQVIIPYLIAVLMDKSANIRRAAAECTLALSQYYRAKPPNGEQTLQPIELGELITQDVTSKDVDTVPKGFIDLIQKILLPDLEECVLDADTISIVLVTALNGASLSQKGTIKANGLDLKSSRRTSIFTFLAGHAVSAPLLSIRLRLLTVLNQVGKISSTMRTQLLIPALRRWLALTSRDLHKFCDIEFISLYELDLELFRVISSREKDGVHLLKQIFAGEYPVARVETFKAAHQRLQEIWGTIKSGDREPIALALLGTALSTNNSVSDIHRELAMGTLQTLQLSTDVLVSLVECLPNAFQMPDKPPAAKRRRTSRSEMARFVPVDTVELTHALRRYTLVLELIESSKPADHPELLKGLFHVLGEIHDYRAQTDSGMVYLQGLAINSLLAIVDRLKVCVSNHFF